MTEDEIVAWHHQLNGYKFEQTPGDGEGQGSMLHTVHGVTESQIQLSNRTTTKGRKGQKKRTQLEIYKY